MLDKLGMKKIKKAGSAASHWGPSPLSKAAVVAIRAKGKKHTAFMDTGSTLLQLVLYLSPLEPPQGISLKQLR